MENIKVCPMAAHHIPRLAQLEQLCFSEPWSEAGLSAELDNENAFFRVAQAADDSYPYHARTRNSKLGLFPCAVVHTTHGMESVGIRVFAGNQIVFYLIAVDLTQIMTHAVQMLPLQVGVMGIRKMLKPILEFVLIF